MKPNKKNINIRLHIATLEKLRDLSENINISPSSIVELLLLNITNNNILSNLINNNDTIEATQIKAQIQTQTETQAPAEPKQKPKTNKKTPEPIKTQTEEEKKQELYNLNVRMMKEAHIQSIYGNIDIDINELDESYFKTMSPIPKFEDM